MRTYRAAASAAAGIALAAALCGAAGAARIARVVQRVGSRRQTDPRGERRASRDVPPPGAPTLRQMLDSISSDARLLPPLPKDHPGRRGGPDAASLGAASDAGVGASSASGGGGIFPPAGGLSTGARAPSAARSPVSGTSQGAPIPWRASPGRTGLLFPDIYEGDTVTDWDMLNRASHGIVIMKVRQSRLDYFYARRIREAEKRGMLVIGYAFGYGMDGAAQADAFAANFPLRPGRVMALDFEHNPYGSSMTYDEAAAFVERIRARTGRYPLLYASASVPRPGALARCPAYVADWGRQAPGRAVIWQFTDGKLGPAPHAFPGIAGISDVDRLMVPYEYLRALAGLGAAAHAAVATLAAGW